MKKLMLLALAALPYFSASANEAYVSVGLGNGKIDDTFLVIKTV